MPSKLVLPSASVLSSRPPRPCLPCVLTGCMITAALRTGLPLSSFRMRKFSTAVGSVSLSRCADATARSAKSNSRQARVCCFICLFILTHGDILTRFISGHSSEWAAGKEEVKARELRLPGGPAFMLCTRGRARQLYQVAGNPGGVVTGDAALFQVISQNRDHAQSFDGIEIGNDLARTLERILGLEFIGNGRAIDQSVVEDLLAGVAIESADVIGGRKA